MINRRIILGFLILGLGFMTLRPVYAESPNLIQLVAQLQSSPDDIALRKKIIKLVRKMPSKPELPEGLTELMGQAKYAIKDAKSPHDFKDAVDIFKKVSLLAPWKADVYYDLGLVQEKAEMPEDAITSYGLYLAANPNAKDKSAIEEKVGGLKYEVEKRKGSTWKMNLNPPEIWRFGKNGKVYKSDGSESGWSWVINEDKITFSADWLKDTTKDKMEGSIKGKEIVDGVYKSTRNGNETNFFNWTATLIDAGPSN